MSEKRIPVICPFCLWEQTIKDYEVPFDFLVHCPWCGRRYLSESCKKDEKESVAKLIQIVFLKENNRIMLLKNPKNGLWNLPGVTLKEQKEPLGTLKNKFEKMFPGMKFKISQDEPIYVAEKSFPEGTIRNYVYLSKIEKYENGKSSKFFNLDQIEKVKMPKSTKEALRQLPYNF